MKLLLDEMWPASVAEALRAAGYDVVAVIEQPGIVTSSDNTVFRVAIAQQRALITEDTDFRLIAAQWLEQGHSHFGLILTTNRTFPRGDARTMGRLVNALRALLRSAETLENTEYWLPRSG